MRARHSKSNCRWYWTLIDCIFFYTIIPMIKSNLWIKHSKRVTITNAKKEQLQKSTVIKVMWIWFLSKHLIVRYSPLVLWWREMIKCLHGEMKDVGNVMWPRVRLLIDCLIMCQKEDNLLPDCGWPRVTETKESIAMDRRGLVYILFISSTCSWY